MGREELEDFDYEIINNEERMVPVLQKKSKNQRNVFCAQVPYTFRHTVLNTLHYTIV